MIDQNQMDVNQAFDHISKYLTYEVPGDTEYYFPIIVKNEWNGHSNAYWAFYGKEVKYGFSRKKVLFAVCASSYDEVVSKFLRLYLDYEAEGYIRGKAWFGSKPHPLDLNDDICDHSLIE